MLLKTATHKPTGFRYFYAVKVFFGETRYSADCSADCVGPGAVKASWHSKLSDARKSAAERGTLMAAI